MPPAPRPRRRYTRPGDLTYTAAHNRVRAERGSPTNYTCVTCTTKPAAEWSYTNDDPKELTDRKTGCAYSTDPQRYQPRCHSCHRKLDWAARRRDRPPLDPAKVVQDYQAGWTLTSIARSLRYSPAEVRQVLVENGVTIDPLRRARPWPTRRRGR